MINRLSPLFTILISTLAFGGVTYLLQQQRFIFTDSNLEVCALIIVLFVISFLLIFRYYGTLLRQGGAIEKVKEAVLLSREDVDAVEEKLPPNTWMRDRIHQINMLDNLDAEIDNAGMTNLLNQRFQNAGGIIRLAIVSLAVVGLIGSFLSMIQLNQMGLVISDLLPIVSGSTILGLLGALSLGFMFISTRQLHHNILDRIEEMSLFKVLPFFRKRDKFELDQAVNKNLQVVLPKVVQEATAELRNASKNLFGATNNLINLQTDVLELVDNFRKVTGNMDDSSSRIADQVQSFNQQLEKIQSTLHQVNNNLNSHEGVIGELTKVNQQADQNMHQITQKVSLSNEHLVSYVKVREKLFEQLLVDLNLTMSRLNDDISKLMREYQTKQPPSSSPSVGETV